MRCPFARPVFLVVAGIAPAVAAEGIGHIEFFGYKGLDVAQIRRALPVHEGDEYSGRTKDVVWKAVAGAIGREPTDVAAICCDEKGNHILFIGLPGASNRSFAFNPEPGGHERLPAEIMEIYGRLDRAIEAAVRKGGEAVQEDDSNGYALINDPAARSLQLAVRQWAVAHEPELGRVLEFSSAAEHRRVASDAMGYARRSPEQIRALVRAVRDRDDEVRNNATRALGVLVRSDPALATKIPPDAFVEMLNSGRWTDRNKASWLLMAMTAGRDSALLAKLRSDALDSLIEMARWRAPGHASSARIVLGRAAGIPEDRLNRLAWNGPVDEIIEAARRR